MVVNKGYLAILGKVLEEDQLKQNDIKTNFPNYQKNVADRRNEEK